MIRPGKMIRQVLYSMFKRPATTRYPLERSEMPDKFRGKLLFHPELCVGCRMCMKDCPSQAITIKEAGEKKFDAEIDLGKCVYCAQCVDSCFKKAIEATKEYELAALKRRALKVTFNESTKEDPKT